MRILCLQHVAFEGPGALGTWAAAHGFPVATTRLFANEPLPGADDYDLLVLLGGPMSVQDEARFDWLQPEKRFVRRAIEGGKPVLGICLGAQLIAHATGAMVYAGKQREIGWFPVRKTPGSAALTSWNSLPDLKGNDFQEPVYSVLTNRPIRSTACSRSSMVAQ